MEYKQFYLNYYKNTDLNKAPKATCDKYDYMFSIFSGMICGVVDIFFVASPLKSTSLTKLSSDTIDKIVVKFAKMNNFQGNDIGNAISYLERKFKVNYDQAKTSDVNNLFNMYTKNHHIKNLAHSSDVIGLFFSLVDQYTGKSHFIDNGQIISIDSDGTLYGKTFIEKMYCGVINWFGHLMSDIAGSSGSRSYGKQGKGSGICIPFMELFQFCNIGSFNYKDEKLSLAQISVKLFENGYDFRFGITMAIPVLLNELLIRFFWVVKRHFYHNYSWNQCIPSLKNNTDLRFMVLIGTCTLCVIDGIDSFVKSGGNVVLFLLNLNMIAWMRLIYLIIKELIIIFGPKVLNYFKSLIDIFSCNVKNEIYNFNLILQNYQCNLDKQYELFVDELNKQYYQIERCLNNLNKAKTIYEKRDISISLAKSVGVNESKIIKNSNDLDKFMLGPNYKK